MTRHRRDQENPRLARPCCLLEAQKRGEGSRKDRLLCHRNKLIAGLDGFDPKREPGVDYGQIGEGFQNSRESTEWPILAQWRPRKAQRRPGGGGERPDLIEKIRLGSIGLINH